MTSVGSVIALTTRGDKKLAAILDPATATPELLGSYMTGEMQGAA